MRRSKLFARLATRRHKEFGWGKLCQSKGQAQAVIMGGAGRWGKTGRAGELVHEDHVAPTMDLE